MTFNLNVQSAHSSIPEASCFLGDEWITPLQQTLLFIQKENCTIKFPKFPNEEIWRIHNITMYIYILTLLCAALAIEKPVRSCQNRGNPSGAFNYLPGSTFFCQWHRQPTGGQAEKKNSAKPSFWVRRWCIFSVSSAIWSAASRTRRYQK